MRRENGFSYSIKREFRTLLCEPFLTQQKVHRGDEEREYIIEGKEISMRKQLLAGIDIERGKSRMMEL